MKKAIVSIIVLALLVLPVAAQISNSQGQDRFRINPAEPDGFLGLRRRNTFRYGEDLFGEPKIRRNGSLEWQFLSADFDPYEALTVLGDKQKINGFVAHLRPNRIQFTLMDLHPTVNKFGTWSATKYYESGKYKVSILVVGDDA